MSEQNDLESFIEFCDSKFGKKVMKIEAAFIEKELKGYEKILDVGCGIGVFEELLPEFNIRGVDSSKLFLEEAKKRNKGQDNKKFFQGNAEDLPFKNNSFDAVFSVATIEFIDNYEKALREIYRVLKIDGKVVIMILNPSSEHVKGHRRRKGSYYNKIKHKNLKGIRSYCSRLFNLETTTKYFLGIQGENIYDTDIIRYAALFVIIGKKVS